MTDAATEADVKKPRSLGSWIGTSLSIALLLLVLAAGVVLIAVPKALGAIPLTILTQSMEPLLPPGTLVVDQPITADQVQLGNVVTYQIKSGEPDVITHRVVGISVSSTGERTFTFKGDNNADPDADKVIPAQIKGRLIYSVPWIGYVSLWMNGPARAIVIPIAAAILFIFAGFMFGGGIMEEIRKRRRARTPAPIA